MRVIYLLTYLPKWTARMFKKNRTGLYEAIAAEVDGAMDLQRELRKEGKLAADQIAEVVQSVVAPTEAVPPESSGMSEDLYLEIREWAENPPEIPEIETIE